VQYKTQTQHEEPCITNWEDNVKSVLAEALPKSNLVPPSFDVSSDFFGTKDVLTALAASAVWLNRRELTHCNHGWMAVARS
jgi:hypothetical protein